MFRWPGFLAGRSKPDQLMVVPDHSPSSSSSSTQALSRGLLEYMIMGYNIQTLPWSIPRYPQRFLGGNIGPGDILDSLGRRGWAGGTITLH